jgi:hypothetical protein
MRRRPPEDILIVIAVLLFGQGIALIAYPTFLLASRVANAAWLYYQGVGQ